MTQEQVAAELGVSRQAIDVWEEGMTSNAKISKTSSPPDWRVRISTLGLSFVRVLP